MELDCGLDVPGEVLASQVCNSGKVTDRHAVVPTRSASAADLSALPLGEGEVLLDAGWVKLTSCWSEKTGKTYDVTVILEDDGKRTNYKLEFGHE